MMKRYRIEYWIEDRSKPWCLTQISKSGKRDGVSISFYVDVIKCWQNKYKNGLPNGIDKKWNIIGENWHFTNWKKGNEQGIQIKFKLKKSI